MSANYVMLLRSGILTTLLCLSSLSFPFYTAESTGENIATFFPMENGSSNEDEDEIKGPAKSTGSNVEIGTRFFTSLGIDLVIIALIIVSIYYPNYKKMDTVFTFVLFNLIIFMLTYVFNTVKISMGAAFGLFAVFSMLRYRTSGINMKDMTYLLIFIGIGLLSAIQMDFYEQIIIGAVIFAVTFIMDTKLILKKESLKSIRFEDINLIQPEKEKELIEVLKKRTGLNINRVSVEEIDYLRDIAMITIYYYE